MCFTTSCQRNLPGEKLFCSTFKTHDRIYLQPSIWYTKGTFFIAWLKPQCFLFQSLGYILLYAISFSLSHKFSLSFVTLHASCTFIHSGVHSVHRHLQLYSTVRARLTFPEGFLSLGFGREINFYGFAIGIFCRTTVAHRHYQLQKEIHVKRAQLNQYGSAKSMFVNWRMFSIISDYVQFAWVIYRWLCNSSKRLDQFILKLSSGSGSGTEIEIESGWSEVQVLVVSLVLVYLCFAALVQSCRAVPPSSPPPGTHWHSTDKITSVLWNNIGSKEFIIL